MKNLSIFSLLILTLFFSTSCVKTDNNNTTDNNTDSGNVNDPDKTKLTMIEFEEKQFDFGKIIAGEKVTHIFNFKNSGTQPLIISKVKPSCSCTTPDWSKDPIAPGKKGYIKVIFDSKGKKGMTHKSVTVSANTQEQNFQLMLTGEVTQP